MRATVPPLSQFPGLYRGPCFSSLFEVEKMPLCILISMSYKTYGGGLPRTVQSATILAIPSDATCVGIAVRSICKLCF